MNVGILVLAAGRSTRFGSDKRLAKLANGCFVIDALLDNLRESGLPCMVCLSETDRWLANHLEEQDIACACLSRAKEGMGGTLAEGIGHIPGWDGVLVALADMPWISSNTYRFIAARLSQNNICVPVYDHRRGHPVGFGSDFYPDLAALGGDTGARLLLQRYASHIVELPVQDSSIHDDIDQPSDVPGVGAMQSR